MNKNLLEPPPLWIRRLRLFLANQKLLCTSKKKKKKLLGEKGGISRQQVGKKSSFKFLGLFVRLKLLYSSSSLKASERLPCLKFSQGSVKGPTSTYIGIPPIPPCYLVCSSQTFHLVKVVSLKWPCWRSWLVEVWHLYNGVFHCPIHVIDVKQSAGILSFPKSKWHSHHTTIFSFTSLSVL